MGNTLTLPQWCNSSVFTTKKTNFQRLENDSSCGCDCHSTNSQKHPQDSRKWYKDIGSNYVVSIDGKVHKDEDMLIYLIDATCSQISHTLTAIQKQQQTNSATIAEHLFLAAGAKSIAPSISGDDVHHSEEGHKKKERSSLVKLLSNELDASITSAEITTIIPQLAQTLNTLTNLKNQIQLAKMEHVMADNLSFLELKKELKNKITPTLSSQIYTREEYISAVGMDINRVLDVLSKIDPNRNIHT